MTEGGQFIKGFKRFTDDQISFGQTISTPTSTIEMRMAYGTVSQSGDIRHNIVGSTQSWDGYATTNVFQSATTIQVGNLKQEVTWKNSTAELGTYFSSGSTGSPAFLPKYAAIVGILQQGSRFENFLIDPRVRNNSHYAGSPIIKANGLISYHLQV